MIRRNFISCLILLCLVLTSCGGKTVIRPTVLQDAESFTNGGLKAFEEANWNNSQLLFARALSLYQGIDDQQGVLYSHINLAEVALSTRDYSKSRKHLDVATDIAKKNSLQHYQGRITLLYALNALQQKKAALAEVFLQTLLPEFDQDKPVNTPDFIQVAAIANRTKIAFIEKLDESLWTRRYANALIKLDAESPDLEARLLRFQASLLQRQGNYAESESSLQQALSRYKTSFSRSGIAATLSELGALYISLGRWENASDFLNRSITVFRYLGNIDRVIQNTESLVIVEKELGHLERSNTLNQWLVEMKNK